MKHLCWLLGHRYAESYPYLSCGRCGRHRERPADDQGSDFSAACALDCPLWRRIHWSGWRRGLWPWCFLAGHRYETSMSAPGYHHVLCSRCKRVLTSKEAAANWLQAKLESRSLWKRWSG